MTTILSPVEALTLVADGLDDTTVGALAGRPLLAVAVDGGQRSEQVVSRLAEVLRETPVVLVGVATGDGPPPGTGIGLDVLLCAGPVGSAPRPWVACPDGVEAELERLAAAVDHSPGASVALAQLLRVGEPLSAADAVVAESWVYSLLQAGQHHRDWLDARAERPRKPRPDRPVVMVERRGPVLAVTFDRPEVRNAYGTRSRDELVAALQLAAVDESVEVVELRGNGPAFCSGGDLDEFGTAGDAAAAHVVRTTRNAGIQLARLADRAHAFVHGPCVGAGVELPAFARRVTARSDATFLLPEVAMGLVPGAGGTASIPRRIGRHRTAHLAIAGRPIDVVTALDWGLVDAVDDDSFPPRRRLTPEPTPMSDTSDPTAGSSDWSTWRQRVDLGEYDERWERMAAAGENPHGEADLVSRYEPASVLDAGCGTGRVGIELARRGVEVEGTDLDPDLLERARAKAPDLSWHLSDLSSLDLGRTFDVVVMAGNVVGFVAAPDRAAAVAAVAAHVAPGGRLISGCQLRAGWPSIAEYDEWCAAAGLELEDRFATWAGDPLGPSPDYSVAVHRRPPT